MLEKDEKLLKKERKCWRKRKGVGERGKVLEKGRKSWRKRDIVRERETLLEKEIMCLRK